MQKDRRAVCHQGFLTVLSGFADADIYAAVTRRVALRYGTIWHKVASITLL